MRTCRGQGDGAIVRKRRRTARDGRRFRRAGALENHPVRAHVGAAGARRRKGSRASGAGARSVPPRRIRQRRGDGPRPGRLLGRRY